MSMRKKDYEAIARAISLARPPMHCITEANIRQHEDAVALVGNVAANVADYCATQDVNFKRDRFLKACGVQS